MLKQEKESDACSQAELWNFTPETWQGFVQLRGFTTPEFWRVLNPLVKSTRIAGGRESVSWAGLWDQGDVSNQKLPLAMNSRRPKLG